MTSIKPDTTPKKSYSSLKKSDYLDKKVDEKKGPYLGVKQKNNPPKALVSPKFISDKQKRFMNSDFKSSKVGRVSPQRKDLSTIDQEKQISQKNISANRRPKNGEALKEST
mmetsp:Transcript_27447/g.26517  ORF Transcript_27447/g.26517 Transcript_27447/m.26517 type:complete len:111 (+) Transcript_27447:832-1164(+)